MPSTIGFTFTAIPAGDGVFAFRHCKTMEIICVALTTGL